MSEWCQNKECCYKKNQNQMRGKKGNKYYQSNKAHSYYYDMFCCQGCFHAWFKANKNTCMNAVGTIDKQTVNVEDSWFVEYKYDYRTSPNNRYHLVNKLKGVDQGITQQQAQTPEDIQLGHNWNVISQKDSKQLAITLGLAS